MIGEALGNYTITARLGGGTMGVVFRAEHARIARTAAIKVLVPELAQNASAVQRFFTEARATSLIRHPGIVEVFDCDVDAAGRAYIVMEHLEGETLADRLQRTERLAPALACDIARQVARAIAAAHDNGIVHRDLKPENIFLVRDPADLETVGAVKVLDFGIAKLLAADPSARVTMRGMVLGTPEYMAPEQCGGAEEIDERADVYALGCILFEMLSGEPPFTAATVQELMVAHMFQAVPAIDERVPALSAGLAGVITGMLAKHRDERPISMHEVARALGERAKPPPMGAPAATSRWGGRKAPVVVAAVGLSALVAALWNTGSVRRGAGARAAAAVASSTAMIERARPLAAPPAIVVPVRAPASIPPGAEAPVVPPPHAREEGADRPAHAARARRAGAPKPKPMVDTDGIVDL